MKRLFARLNAAPLWLYIPVVLAWCFAVTGAAYAAGNLAAGYPIFARPYMLFFTGIPLSLLIASGRWRHHRHPRSNGPRNADSA